MITGVRHTGIVVKDIDSALDFWVNVLEFDVVSNQIETGKFIDNLLGLDSVTVQTIKLIAKDKTMIELLHFKSHPCDNLWDGTPYSNGLTHVALNTLDNLREGKKTCRPSELVAKARTRTRSIFGATYPPTCSSQLLRKNLN